VKESAPSGTIFNIGGERALLAQDLDALIAELMGYPRRRIVLPGSLGRIAGALCLAIGRRSSLADMCRGQHFSAAVDDRRFHERYPAVLRIDLVDGLREHISSW
jgi:hypothetical protein